MQVESVKSVYLRKQAYGTSGEDDGVNLNGASMWLRDADDTIFSGRQFSTHGIPAGNGLWLANEHGHQVWLKEIG